MRKRTSKLLAAGLASVLAAATLLTTSLLKAHCIPVTLYSLTKSMNKWDETEDEIFVLTEADMFGTTGGTPTEDTRNYTYVSDGKCQVLVSNPEMRKAEKMNIS